MDGGQKTSSQPSLLRKISPMVTAILATCPLMMLISLYSFVLRARIQLGRWPAPYNPDPKNLGFDLHYLQITMAAVTTPLASFACLIWTVGMAHRWRDYPK